MPAVSKRPSVLPEQGLPSVAILLCTYDGERFLAEQLESYMAQSHARWAVWVSDDGSHDRSVALLNESQARWPEGKLNFQRGAGAGFAKNFLSLVCRADIEADYYAYSDQDDVWESDKLTRALNWLRTVPAHVPALYCSRTRLVDALNREQGLSPLFSKSPSFSNALVQNIGGGNTMVFNAAARKLLTQAGPNVDIVSHDWWTYLLVAGCGGRVCYDPHPTVRYRQHGDNLVGANKGALSRVTRLRKLFHGRYKGWNDLHMQALAACREQLTEDSRRVLDAFAASRGQWLVPRVLGVWRSGVWRQSWVDNLGLLVAAVCNRI